MRKRPTELLTDNYHSETTNMTEKLKINNGRYVKYSDFPVMTDENARKKWVALIKGYDPKGKYKWDVEFLDSVSIDGATHINIDTGGGLSEGDHVRVKGGSDGSQLISAMRVLARDAEYLEVEPVSDAEAIDAVYDGDIDHGAESLRRDLGLLLLELDSENLSDVKRYVEAKISES